MSIRKVAVPAALVLFLAGCRGGGPPRASAIGEAYVGPAVLKIRSAIPLQSSAVATVKHGDRLEILQTRRRFLRVRTPGGAEGWTDERQLLSSTDMAALRDLATRSSAMLAQGQVARDILQWLQEVSQPFGTNITIKDDVGIIRL